MATKNEQSDVNYQQLVNDINRIIQKLEEDNVPLESALELFEEGLTKTKQADDFINNIKKRVVKLVEQNKVKDFDDNN